MKTIEKTVEAGAVSTPIPAKRRMGMIQSDMLTPEPGKHYFWASDTASHPQSWRNYKQKGYTVVPAEKAERLGLEGYEDRLLGIGVTTDVNNCIRLGDLILMECTRETLVELRRDIDAMLDDVEGIETENGAEAIDAIGHSRRP
jgi:hypothetical protein